MGVSLAIRSGAGHMTESVDPLDLATMLTKLAAASVSVFTAARLQVLGAAVWASVAQRVKTYAQVVNRERALEAAASAQNQLVAYLGHEARGPLHVLTASVTFARDAIRDAVAALRTERRLSARGTASGERGEIDHASHGRSARWSQVRSSRAALAAAAADLFTCSSAARDLSGLVGSVLDFSLLRSERLALTPERVNVVSLLRNVARKNRGRGRVPLLVVLGASKEDQLLSSAAARTSGVHDVTSVITVEAQPSDLPETIVTDGQRLEQAVCWAVRAATNFTSTGFVAIAACVETADGEDHADKWWVARPEAPDMSAAGGSRRRAAHDDGASPPGPLPRRAPVASGSKRREWPQTPPSTRGRARWTETGAADPRASTPQSRRQFFPRRSDDAAVPPLLPGGKLDPPQESLIPPAIRRLQAHLSGRQFREPRAARSFGNAPVIGNFGSRRSGMQRRDSGAFEEGVESDPPPWSAQGEDGGDQPGEGRCKPNAVSSAGVAGPSGDSGGVASDGEQSSLPAAGSFRSANGAADRSDVAASLSGSSDRQRPVRGHHKSKSTPSSTESTSLVAPAGQAGNLVPRGRAGGVGGLPGAPRLLEPARHMSVMPVRSGQSARLSFASVVPSPASTASRASGAAGSRGGDGAGSVSGSQSPTRLLHPAQAGLTVPDIAVGLAPKPGLAASTAESSALPPLSSSDTPAGTVEGTSSALLAQAAGLSGAYQRAAGSRRRSISDASFSTLSGSQRRASNLPGGIPARRPFARLSATSAPDSVTLSDILLGKHPRTARKSRVRFDAHAGEAETGDGGAGAADSRGHARGGSGGSQPGELGSGVRPAALAGPGGRQNSGPLLEAEAAHARGPGGMFNRLRGRTGSAGRGSADAAGGGRSTASGSAGPGTLPSHSRDDSGSPPAERPNRKFLVIRVMDTGSPLTSTVGGHSGGDGDGAGHGDGDGGFDEDLLTATAQHRTTGLGHTLARELVQLMGGRMVLRQLPPEGAASLASRWSCMTVEDGMELPDPPAAALSPRPGRNEAGRDSLDSSLLLSLRQVGSVSGVPDDGDGAAASPEGRAVSTERPMSMPRASGFVNDFPARMAAFPAASIAVVEIWLPLDVVGHPSWSEEELLQVFTSAKRTELEPVSAISVSDDAGSLCQDVDDEGIPGEGGDGSGFDSEEEEEDDADEGVGGGRSAAAGSGPSGDSSATSGRFKGAAATETDDVTSLLPQRRRLSRHLLDANGCRSASAAAAVGTPLGARKARADAAARPVSGRRRAAAVRSRQAHAQSMRIQTSVSPRPVSRHTLVRIGDGIPVLGGLSSMGDGGSVADEDEDEELRVMAATAEAAGLATAYGARGDDGTGRGRLARTHRSVSADARKPSFRGSLAPRAAKGMASAPNSVKRLSAASRSSSASRQVAQAAPEVDPASVSAAASCKLASVCSSGGDAEAAGDTPRACGVSPHAAAGPVPSAPRFLRSARSVSEQRGGGLRSSVDAPAHQRLAALRAAAKGEPTAAVAAAAAAAAEAESVPAAGATAVPGVESVSGMDAARESSPAPVHGSEVGPLPGPSKPSAPADTKGSLTPSTAQGRGDGKAARDAARRKRAAARAAARPPKPRPLRVLFVDDDEIVRTTTRRMLERLGAEPIVFEDGDQVEPWLRAHGHIGPGAPESGGGFDLVLSDVLMPGMDGESLCARLADLRFPVPVVAATGTAAPEALQRFPDSGFCGVLCKPYGADQLGAVLEAARQRQLSVPAVVRARRRRAQR